MLCPFCREDSSKVLDSRSVGQGTTIRRRRQCTSCGYRFTTMEKAVLLVQKRSGVVEPFSQDKVIQGVRRACQGRDVSEDSLKRLAQEVEQQVSRKGSQISAHEIGLAILDPLRELDEVAYLRFASVYRSFESADDFLTEIRRMRRSSKRFEDTSRD
ncbi:transcriptional regulator NrdR [Corynebacterium mendelii]|uniref:Transcriptional repressor NrdR n=1 Tax=Corynebacterium mendelii TaxID=2765362 RepID=A0A939IX58_9CORY|nr:transcriptional regulator NrdR [Corynebacterium mendelii]MBN9643327.1 transcriptional repressor NrdR [Corynebacterium mendelii]